ncbi:hypothetical protein VNO77_24892 [Canavalia gladiata]|uniref:Uncharacterized protein n=1 Tax=Canavalia gladiata TaxID=3824 RepID=A0AAN9QD49_CANGL
MKSLSTPKAISFLSPSQSHVHAEPLDGATLDHDFVTKVFRRPASEDCRHEATQKMLGSILQQRKLNKRTYYAHMWQLLALIMAGMDPLFFLEALMLDTKKNAVVTCASRWVPTRNLKTRYGGYGYCHFIG